MKNEIAKLELINWIIQLEDQQSIAKLLALKEKSEVNLKCSAPKLLGSGKHLVEFISDDFISPLDMFEEYRK